MSDKCFVEIVEIGNKSTITGNLLYQPYFKNNLFNSFCEYISQKYQYPKLEGIIKWNVDKIFHLETNDKDYNKAKNYNGVLAYGEVQSGKTLNMIGLIYKAIDLGYKYVFVSATMEDLFDQTIKRFKDENNAFENFVNEFDIKNYDYPNTKQIKHIIGDNAYFNTKVSFYEISDNLLIDTSDTDGIKVFFTMKNTKKYNKIVNLFKNIQEPTGLEKRRILFLDDEADWAFSKKTNSNSGTEGVYDWFLNIKNHFLNKNYFFKYVAFTATPGEILSSPDFDSAISDKQYVLLKNKSITEQNKENLNSFKEYEPYYCGMDFFYNNNKDFNVMGIEPKKITTSINNPEFIEDFIELLHSSLFLFLINSFYFWKDNDFNKKGNPKEDFSQFLIFPGVITKDHENILGLLNKKIKSINKKINDNTFGPNGEQELLNFFEINNQNIKTLLEIKKTNGRDLTLNNSGLVDFIIKWYKKSMDGNLILQFSDDKNKDNEYIEKTKKTNGLIFTPLVIIGGHRISRGITFDNLLCELMLKNTEKEDTAIQRVRWFGHRKFNVLRNMNIIIEKSTYNSLINFFEEDKKRRQELKDIF